MTNKEVAAAIYKVVGPKENILDVQHCMTRLRLQLVSKKYSDDQLKKIDGVKGVNNAGPEVQIVLGPSLARAVTEEFQNIMTGAPVSPEPKKEINPQAFQVGDGKELHASIKAKNATPFKLALKKIANIFMPLVPGFIGCGLLTGLLNIICKINPQLATNSLVQMLAIAGNAVFWGMNLFVGINTAKEFGGTPILGGVMGAIVTHPGLSKITLFGSNLLPGRGGIIAVILVVIFASYLEKWLHKAVPAMLDLFLTPFLTIGIASLVALCILQPVGGVISEQIGFLATTAVAKGGAFTGFVLGGIWLPMVMLGIHQGMTPIHAELLSRYGVTILLPILAMAGGGQVGAAAAVYFKTKNSRVKKTVASALPVGIMGVGEPLIYGVTLPLGKPFIGACIGGALGGAVQAFAVVGASTLGLSGLPLVASTDNMPVYLAGLLVSYLGGFIATWFLGFDDPKEEE
jgi:PTS system sucrose-specific IIC component